MRYDDVLTLLGEFGRYQRVMYTLLCLPIIFVGIQIMSPVFTLATPNHRCAIPGLLNDTYEIQNDHHRSLVQFYIPTDEKEGGYAKCKIYKRQRPDIELSCANDTLGYILAHSDNETVTCNDWVFDKSVFDNTAITDCNLRWALLDSYLWREHRPRMHVNVVAVEKRSTISCYMTNIVCANTIFRAHATTALNVGAIFSFLAGGPIADRFGRKLVSMIDLVLMIVSSTLLVWLPNIYVFIAIRLVIGLGFGVFYNVIFVYAMEFVGQSKRTVFGIIVNYFWAVGLLVQSLLAYYIRTWRTLQLITSLPLAGFLLYWWKLPNSGRWLFAEGYVEEGRKVLADMARVNKIDIDVTNLSIDIEHDKDADKGWKVIELMKYKTLAIRSLVVWFNWFVVALLYFGLSLNVGNLGGDIFLNFAISAIMEVVGYSICIPGMYRMGRKRFHCTCMLTGGGALLLVIFPQVFGNKSTGWVVILFSMAGKLASSAAYAVIYLYSVELFPTVVRGSALGICAACATVGGFTAPYIVELANLLSGSYAKILPLLVFGVTSFIAGLLSLKLPETSNVKLPDTIQDMKLQNTKDMKNNVNQMNSNIN